MKKINCILMYGDTPWPGSKSAGPFRIATELRNHGYTVQTIDIAGYRPDKGFDDLKEVVKNFISDETLWLGFSTTFLYSIIGMPFARTPESFEKRWPARPDQQLKDFVAFVKNLNPNIELVAGGSRRFLLEDYGFTLFRGYSDTEIIDFTNWCANKKETPLALEVKNSEIMGKEFENFVHSNIVYQDEDLIDNSDTLAIEVSRGCIFKCKFCAFPLNGKTKGEWVKKSNVLLDEFRRNYEKFGTTTYVFADDTYNDSLDKVKYLYDEVFSKLEFDLDFTTYLRLDLMMRFPESVSYLKESGLKSAVFGIETINHESGKAVGKGMDPMLQFQFIEELKNNEWKDILIYSGFMLGLPHDTHETLDRFEEFILSDKNKLDTVKIDAMYIHPPRYKHLNRIFYADIDINHEQYGYECYEQIEADPWSEVRWRNHKTGLTFDQVHARARKLEDILTPRKKAGGFVYSYFKSLGIPADELRTLSMAEITAKYDVEELKRRRIAKYKHDIKQLSIRNLLS